MHFQTNLTYIFQIIHIAAIDAMIYLKCFVRNQRGSKSEITKIVDKVAGVWKSKIANKSVGVQNGCMY